MRSIKEIEAKLEELKNDDSFKSPTATLFENAPLALIQLELETKVRVLEWVLKDVV
jgi:hypothetical protein